MIFKGSESNTRKLFLSAILPQGMIDYIESLAENYNVLELHGARAISIMFLNIAIDFAKAMGYDFEVYASPLLPGNPECLAIGELGLFITSKKLAEKKQILDLTPYIMIGDYEKNIIAYNEMRAKELVDAAIKSLADTKLIHDRIESYYTASMDFIGLDEFIEGFLPDIFGS